MKFKAILAGLIVLLAACQAPTSSSPNAETIQWQKQGINLHFSTNDKGLYNTYWAYYWTPNDLSEKFAGTTVVTSRVSGNNDLGHGAIFALQDDDNFGFVMLSYGSYRIVKFVDGEWTDITTEWVQDSAISDVGTETTISITHTDGSSNYFVSFNGGTAHSFTYESSALNSYGFITLIGDDETEKFPSIFNHTSFRVTSPFTLPASVSRGLSSGSWKTGSGAVPGLSVH